MKFVYCFISVPQNLFHTEGGIPQKNPTFNIKNRLRDHMNGTIVTHKKSFVNDFVYEK